MADPRDIIDIASVHNAAARHDSEAKPSQPCSRRFLSVWFRCCHTYGRMNRNKEQTHYEGHCPRCGAKVRAAIGPHGTSQRMFEAR
jgi:hypothetical protein